MTETLFQTLGAVGTPPTSAHNRPRETTSPAARAKAHPGRHFRVERGVYVRADRTGKLTYATVVTEGERNVWHSAPTLAAARTLRARLTTRLDEGGTVTRPKAVTLAEYAESWLAAQSGIRRSTLGAYRSHWRTHLRDSLGSRKLATIGKDDVRQLVADLREQGKATATIRRVLQVLSLMYAEAVEDGLALTNPVTALPKRDRKAIRARKGHADFPELDDAQVRSLLAAVPERHRLLVTTALYSGLRQGELLGLRWHDVARDAQGQPILRVRFTLDRETRTLQPLKTDAGNREVPIPDALAKALTAHRLSLPADRSGDLAFVFSTANGTPLHYRNVARRALDPAVTAAKLPRLRWHDLRHVFASVLIADGHPVTYVSHVLGHATPSITLDTYSHLFARQATAAEHRAAAEARLAGVAL